MNHLGGTRPSEPVVSMVKRKRAEEFGTLKLRTMSSVVLKFEGAPIWILGIPPIQIDSIYIPDFISFSDLQRHLENCEVQTSIFYHMVTLIGRRRFRFRTMGHPGSVWLVSGSPQFLNEQFLLLRKEMALFVTDSHKIWRRLPSTVLALRRLTHDQCGGGTMFSVLFGATVSCELRCNNLRRSIGDFIDHSWIGKYSDHLPTRFTSETKLYPINTSTCEVKYATRRVRQGWICRTLTPKELGRLFNYDMDLAHPCVMKMVPRSMLTSLLDTIRLQDDSSSIKQTLQPMALPVLHKESTSTWLRSLNRALPHDWRASAETTSTSVKHDDATVQTAIWDLRISTLFPSFTSAVLNRLREVLFGYCKRRLYKSFIHFLKSTHPVGWAAYVVRRLYNTKGGRRPDQQMALSSTQTSSSSTSSSTRKSSSLTPSTSFFRDLEQGREVIWAYVNSSFFEWDSGSALIFWRWPTQLIPMARDGFRPYFVGHLPSNLKTPRAPAKDRMEATWNKFKKALKRRYLIFKPVDTVKSFVDYFQIPKGTSDIRMVLNGTSCGLNSSVFTPNFWLPYSPTMTRLLHYEYKYIDLDVGECFHNYGLYRELIPYSGVDLTCFRKQIARDFPDAPHLHDKRIAAVWTRTWFGFRQSPEVSFMFHHIAEEIIRGDRRDENNALRFDRVIINAIGNKDYNPSLPNVFKFDDIHKRIAGDLIAYVDDLRTLGYSLEEAWRIARQVMSRLQYLGIQDAARKRRIGDGPWAGGVYTTDQGKIRKTVTKEKWQKGRTFLVELKAEYMKDTAQSFCYKRLEKIRGFFCHLSMVFECFTPYLKGFHLSLAQHLPKRNEDGWKLSDTEWTAYVSNQVDEGIYSSREAELLIDGMTDVQPHPPWVVPVPRFWQCLDVLLELMSPEIPPQITVRAITSVFVVYGFADASGSGFGNSLLIHGEVRYRIGIWGSDEKQNSSNWRELANLVESMEKAGKRGWLTGNVVMLATDNEVAERALYKGNSSDEKLFSLVVRMRKLELKYGCQLRVTHVAGTRMMSQGTDGISRGDMDQGVASGQQMLQHCPWGRSAVDVSDTLLATLSKWCDRELKVLQPEDWYECGHDIVGWKTVRDGIKHPLIQSDAYVWCPPPAAADACVEQLRIARGKRKRSLHVVVIPKLMTPIWLKNLNKVSDLTFQIAPVHSFWGSHLHENLIVAFVFPFLPYRPWQLRSTPKMLAMGRELCKVFKTQEMAGGDILRKFLLEVKEFPRMQSRMVWRMLYFGEHFKFPGALSTDKQERGHSGKRRRGKSTQGSRLGQGREEDSGLSRGKRRRCINDAF